MWWCFVAQVAAASSGSAPDPAPDAATTVQHAPGQAPDPAVSLERAMDLIEARYGDKVDRDDLYRAALAGVAHRLDQVLGTDGHAVLTEQQHRQALGWLRGERNGVGAEFRILAGRGIYLTEIYPGSPAERAGLNRGDLVVAINDHPLTGRTSTQIFAITRSLDGPHVVFDVRRNATGRLDRVDVERGTYVVPTVKADMDGNTLCIDLRFFALGTARALARALSSASADVEAAGGADPAHRPAVVIDLRDNAGGLLDEAMAAADLFVERGTVLAHKVGPDGTSSSITATEGRKWDGQVVLLVNGGTRDVAEAFVAALRDDIHAMVVGTRTAGVAAIPSFHPIGPDLVLELADTSLRSPSGWNWSNTGIQPDVRVAPTELALPGGPSQAPADVQRDTAVRLVSAP